MKVNLQARIKKTKFDEIAAESFRGSDSKLIQELKSSGRDALLGIESEDGFYSVLGGECLYYLGKLKFENSISYSDLLPILKRNAMSKGQGGDFDFVYLDDGDGIWFKDGQNMTLMWNLISLLYNA